MIEEFATNLVISDSFWSKLFANFGFQKKDELEGLSFTISENKLKLLYSDSYLDNLDESQFSLAFKHNALHLLLGHHSLRPSFKNQLIFDAAADLQVSEVLKTKSDCAELVDGMEPSNYYKIDKIYNYLDQIKIGKILPILLQARQKLNLHNYWNRSSTITKNTFHTYTFTEKEIPSKIKAYLPNRIEREEFENKLNWKLLLYNFVSNSRQTSISFSNNRRSKRYGSIPGLKINKKCALYIAIDTSASMTDDEILKFFAEMQNLHQAGHEITILESDDVLRRTYLYKGVQPEFVKGRGNTNFDEVLKWYDANHFAESLIFFTDGKGPIPKVKTKKKILWLIVQNGIRENDFIWKKLPGKVVKI